MNQRPKEDMNLYNNGQALTSWLLKELRAKTGLVVINTTNEEGVIKTLQGALLLNGRVPTFWTPVSGWMAGEITPEDIFSGPLAFNAAGGILTRPSARTTEGYDQTGSDVYGALSQIAANIREPWEQYYDPQGKRMIDAIEARSRDAEFQEETARQDPERASYTQWAPPPGAVRLSRAWILQGSELWLDKEAREFDPLAARLCLEVARANKLRWTDLILVLPPDMRLPPALSEIASFYDDPLPDKAYLTKTMFPDFKKGVRGADLQEIVNTAGLEDLATALLTGLSRPAARNALVSSLAQAKDVEDFLGRLKQSKARELKTSAALEMVDSVPIEHVGGLEALKTWLFRQARTFSPAARERGIPCPLGAILAGPPGAGKSLCAKAISSILGLPLVRFDVGACFGSLVGESEKNMRAALRAADAMAPCVVWLDEIEKAFAGVGSSNDSGTSERVFGTFLTWMQERDPELPVFVAATANALHRLPPELLRKGRFSEIFFVDLPTPEERQTILKIHVKKANTGVIEAHHIHLDESDLVEVAAAMHGFVGAEIEEALNEARVTAFADGVSFSKAHLLLAVEATTPLSVTRKESIDAMRAWAEGRARHASNSAPRRAETVVTDYTLRSEFDLQ